MMCEDLMTPGEAYVLRETMLILTVFVASQMTNMYEASFVLVAAQLCALELVSELTVSPG